MTNLLGDQTGPYFGEYGGRFVPEPLIAALDELEATYLAAKADPSFALELADLHKNYTGRPSIITEAPRFAKEFGDLRVFLKREDLNHTGSHKINNVMGQALLAKRMGKKRIIAETGAGQHGVASATAAAYFDLDCVVYMGEVDTQRQALNVARMKLLGAEVIPVTTGSRTLKDAINEALRDWVANVDTTHYLLGTVAGPHPFPTMVRDFHSVIGNEARAQMLELTGKLPDVVAACVGGGSNAIGIFHAFLDDPDVSLWGFEAAGDGIDTPQHSATLSMGTPGVLHGARSYLLQDEDGQTMDSHSISAGLDYPGVGPEHSWLKDLGRANYFGITDAQAMNAMRLLSQTEGIIPAIETAHALAGIAKLAEVLPKGSSILINLSGRGDKDMETAGRYFGLLGDK
ncbi:tryptophan synthase subunit beta [Candidatus Aquiluna sp. UB-MaderosW2red]|uniref:tryptophan synthase subunit beta n=1 Tax=Candidatus Aquiluna sp. UB-MaderosW2red TaxID=1855377 RepID=UPI000875AF85|nr:tryptophan synthase subunit beta [Candidatus Aquiluna sp. UB-MaderosW2red]SCX11810.1 tryptophan synthase beta chain [Candidatus Aquiluna sp. UB-MaderosW2red]